MPGDRLDRMGFFDRLKSGLTRTTEQIARRFDELVGAGRHARTAQPAHRRRHGRGARGAADLRPTSAWPRRTGSWPPSAAARVAARACASWCSPRSARSLPTPSGPCHRARRTWCSSSGVNGTGKTTTVGKLANLARSQGQQPLICAADTFRAAAVDQLQIWADRAGVEMIRDQRRRRPGGRRVTTRSSPAAPAAAARCWSTPPGACTRAPT